MPEPRQAEVGGDVVEFEAVARRDQPCQAITASTTTASSAAARLSSGHPARRNVVDGVDEDVLVAQEHARQREKERAGEQQLDQLVDAADRQVEARRAA